MTSFAAIIFFGVVCWYLVLIFRAETGLKKIFWPALIYKVLAGVGLGMVYTYYYKVGDTLGFFSDAVRLSEFAQNDSASYLYFLFKSDFLKDNSVDLTFFNDERALLMVKIVSVFSLLSFDNYWLITIYITLISFLGAWFLVKQISHAFPAVTGSAILAFLFFPSIVFWTSGLIKEALAMASLYFITGIFLKVWFKKYVNVLTWLITILALYILWSLKYYFAGVFLAVVFASLLFRFVSGRFVIFEAGIRSYLLWFGIFFTLIAGVTFLHPNFNSHKLLNVMVQNYNTFHAVSRPEAVIDFKDLTPTMYGLLVSSPEALFAGLFRPLFFDATNVLAIVISVENLALLVLTLLALKHSLKIFTSNVSILLIAIIVYVMLLAIFITLSTPNFGTLARYRVGYLPFFVFLILLTPPVASRLQHVLNRFVKAF
jgi:hypothetical protein